MTLQQLNPKTLAHRAGRWYIERICRNESEGQTWREHAQHHAIDYRFAMEALSKYRPQSVLDVGSGTTAWPHLMRNCGHVVTAIDNVRDYWGDGMFNRHWRVIDEDITDPNGISAHRWDAITCLGVVQHIRDHVRAVQNMVNLLNPGGILVLTTPYSHFHPYPDVYRHPEAIYGQTNLAICRSSSAAELQDWLACGLTLERRELWRLFTGHVWDTGEWLVPYQQIHHEGEPHQFGCFVFRKR